MNRTMIALGLLAAAGCTASALAGDISGGTTLAKTPLDHAVIYTTRISTDQPVRVRPFSAENADVGKTGKKKNKDLAEQMKESVPQTLLATFLEELQAGGFGDVAELAEGDEIPGSALIVQGEITVLDPGSRAKRYFAGLGAGKSKVCAKGTIVDTEDSVLLEFDHCRIGVGGIGGGKSEKQMETDSSQTGSHLAEFMVKWANGRYE